MKTISYQNIEYSEVLLSELGQEMRFDADYWDPFYLRNEGIIKAKNHSKLKSIAPNPQYGISIAMNEDGKGYSILKMDNIMDMLAEDKDAKYARISEKIFKQFQLQKYNVLFNRVNSDEFVGRTGIYLMDGEHTFASYLVRVDSGKEYTNCYITAYLNSKYGKTALQRVKRRAVNQANINAKELSNLIIPIPSDTLQKAIQNLIVEAHKQKELSENLYKEAEHILLTELGLEDWKPKTKKFKLHCVEFEVEDTVNSINANEILKTDRFDSEYWNPKYTEIIEKLNSFSGGCAKILDHFSQRNEIVKKVKSEYNYIEIGDIDISTGKANYNLIDSFELPANAKQKVYIGDILYSKVRPYRGAVSILDDEIPNLIVSGAFTILNEIDASIYTKETLYILLRSDIYKTLIMKYNVGSSYPVVKSKNILNLPLPIFDQKVQNTIKIKVNKAIHSHRQSTFHLVNSIRAVEIFIEENEEKALEFINVSKNNF